MGKVCKVMSDDTDLLHLSPVAEEASGVGPQIQFPHVVALLTVYHQPSVDVNGHLPFLSLEGTRDIHALGFYPSVPAKQRQRLD